MTDSANFISRSTKGCDVHDHKMSLTDYQRPSVTYPLLCVRVRVTTSKSFHFTVYYRDHSVQRHKMRPELYPIVNTDWSITYGCWLWLKYWPYVDRWINQSYNSTTPSNPCSNTVNSVLLSVINSTAALMSWYILTAHV